MTDINEHTIDASGKRMGKVAVEAAVFLRGKNSPKFSHREIPEDMRVKIINVAKLDVDEGKLSDKTYVRYTGYPGGLKKESLASRVGKTGFVEPMREAVKGMIPGNKLRSKLMNKLVIEN